MPDPKPQKEKRGGFLGFIDNLQEIMYGMAAQDMSRYAIRTRASM